MACSAADQKEKAVAVMRVNGDAHREGGAAAASTTTTAATPKLRQGSGHLPPLPTVPAVRRGGR